MSTAVTDRRFAPHEARELLEAALEEAEDLLSEVQFGEFDFDADRAAVECRRLKDLLARVSEDNEDDLWAVALRERLEDLDAALNNGG
jgi:hypothetical protein